LLESDLASKEFVTNAVNDAIDNSNIKSNIRELEGALTRLVAFSRLNNGRVIDVAMAESELKDFIYPNENKKITVELIIEIVATHYELTPADLISSKKSKNIAYPRQICMYLCRNLTEYSLEDIGKSLGKRDHTTILYGIQKIEKDMKEDRSLQNTIEVLIKKISPQ
jgi:chromosomal replication initiator protein